MLPLLREEQGTGQNTTVQERIIGAGLQAIERKPDGGARMSWWPVAERAVQHVQAMLLAAAVAVISLFHALSPARTSMGGRPFACTACCGSDTNVVILSTVPGGARRVCCDAWQYVAVRGSAWQRVGLV